MPILLIAVVSGLVGAFLASAKNKNPFLWGLVCFFFPLIGLVILAFSAPEETQEAKTGRAVADALQQAGVTSQPQPIAASDANLAPADEARWRVMTQYDDDIKNAVQRLEPLGTAAVAKFRDIFLILNDKNKIGQIIEDVERGVFEERERLKQLESNAERERQLEIVGRDIAYLFRRDDGYVASLNDGRAIGIKSGEYALFSDLADFRKINNDNRAWEEITSKMERLQFIANVESLLQPNRIA